MCATVAGDPILVARMLAGFARSGMPPLVRAMRPGEWVRNLLVLSPRAEAWVLTEPDRPPDGDRPVLGGSEVGVYQKAAKRRERLSGTYLEAFDRALEWALMGTKAVSAPARVESRVGLEASKTAS
jgi:hypothetical protein